LSSTSPLLSGSVLFQTLILSVFETPEISSAFTPSEIPNLTSCLLNFF